MTSDQIVTQFQQILTTMQRMVAASADVAERVDRLTLTVEMLEARIAALEGKRVN